MPGPPPHLAGFVVRPRSFVAVTDLSKIFDRANLVRAYRWIMPEEFDLDWLPEFKRDVYRQVMKDFFSVEL